MFINLEVSGWDKNIRNFLFYFKYLFVYLEKVGIIFVVFLKSIGLFGRVYCLKKFWDDGIKLVFCIEFSGGWWDFKGFKWLGGCLDLSGKEI